MFQPALYMLNNECLKSKTQEQYLDIWCPFPLVAEQPFSSLFRVRAVVWLYYRKKFNSLKGWPRLFKRWIALSSG